MRGGGRRHAGAVVGAVLGLPTAALPLPLALAPGLAFVFSLALPTLPLLLPLAIAPAVVLLNLEFTGMTQNLGHR